MNVTILTPHPESDAARGRWPSILAQLREALGAFGIEAGTQSWAEELAGDGPFLPLLAWGYHEAGPLWLEQLKRWEERGVRMLNPLPVLRWNADKSYLGRLAERGAPIVPTLYADRLTGDVLQEATRRFGTERLVAKPQVSAGAWQTIRWSPGETFSEGPTGPAMVQPYLPSIESGGEVSLLYFRGVFSHAIRKRPQPGDFRVQPEYQGIITPHEPSEDEFGAAQATLAAIGEDLLYARVDLVRDLEGRPALIEVELVEPDLYLGFDPARGAGLAKALKDILLAAKS